MHLIDNNYAVIFLLNQYDKDKNTTKIGIDITLDAAHAMYKYIWIMEGGFLYRFFFLDRSALIRLVFNEWENNERTARLSF